MNLEQIRTRLAEIETRRAQIRSEAQAEGVTMERLNQLNEEVDSLNTERRSLIEQRVALLAEANNGSEPVVRNESENRSEEDPYNTIEYRRAFMRYVRTGVRAGVLQRTDASTTASEISGVIVPTVITDRLFTKDSVAGSIFARVTKTSYPAGISVPKLNLAAQLTWCAENSKPDRDEVTTGTVTFAGYKGQIRISVSLEANTRALEGFEAAIVDAINKACLRGIDKAIVAGSGSNAPTGILTAMSGGAVYSSTGCNAHTLNDATVSDHSEWVSLFAEIPADKESTCTLHINKKDWYKYIIGMKDENGRVVAFDRTGIDGKPVPVFMGMQVVLMEDQGMSAFDAITGSSTKSKTTAFAYFFCDEDYVWNSNMSLTLKTYIDEDTDEVIRKATIIADGKVVDNKSLVIVCRGADAA